MSMSTKKYAALGFGIALGVTLPIAGMQSVAEQEQTASPRVVTKTVVKHDTKTVTVYRLSDACKQVLEKAGAAGNAASKISDVTNYQIDLISRARVAISLKDFDDLRIVTEKQQDLNTDTEEEASTLSSALNNFDNAVDACEQSVQ